MKKRAMSIFSIGILLFFALVCGIYFSMSFGPEYIAKLNNRKIELSEYMIYLREQQLAFEEAGGADIWDTYFDGVSAEAVAKQNALDSIVYVKIMAEKAESEGIRLNDGEKQECRESGAEYYGYIQGYSDLIQMEDMVRVMEDNVLLAKLYEKTAMEYEYSQIDFEDYYLDNRYDFADVFVEHIYIPQPEEADSEDYYEKIEKITAALARGTDMEEIYFSFYDEQLYPIEYSPLVSLKSYSKGIVDDTLYRYLISFEGGSVTEPLYINSELYIFKIVYNDLDDEPALREEMKDSFIAAEQKEMFDDTYRTLLRDAQISKNSIVWDDVTIIK